MKGTEKLTILHSNDMHGAFLPTEENGRKRGGLSLLAGYVEQVRREEQNVIYAVAGDMFHGSVIDSEYQGLSTIDLMNSLRPDVATLGNHEVDYGLAHLLFLEKCARFPLINADLYVTMNNTRLFKPFLNLKVGGLKVLFIGLLTADVLFVTKKEKLIGSCIDLREAVRTVRVLCDNYRTIQTDLTVLLTHIGIEKDKELAAMLDPAWGVDLIIGGHSHTFLEEPVWVNGIPIVQAGCGTEQVGRIDLEIDKKENKIASFRWQPVPLDDATVTADPLMEELIDSYRTETDSKYKRVITRLARKLTHPSREQESEIGNLYADAMQAESSFDIMLLGSGSIRKQELGPIVEYQDIMETTPFDDCVWMLEVTGAQWRRMVQHILRDDAWLGETEFYQFSSGVRIKYDRSRRVIEELRFRGADVTDEMRLKIAMLDYHYRNFDEFLGVPLAEVKENMPPQMIASSMNNIIEEYFSTHDGLDAHVEGRLEVHD